MRDLDLSDNTLGDAGVKVVSAALRDPKCKLEKLRLAECGLTERCCGDLSTAVRSLHSRLRELDLSANNLGDSGKKLLSAAQSDSNCKLEALWFRNVHFFQHLLLQTRGTEVRVIWFYCHYNKHGCSIPDQQVRAKPRVPAESCSAETTGSLKGCFISQEYSIHPVVHCLAPVTDVSLGPEISGSILGCTSNPHDRLFQLHQVLTHTCLSLLLSVVLKQDRTMSSWPEINTASTLLQPFQLKKTIICLLCLSVGRSSLHGPSLLLQSGDVTTLTD